MRPPPEAETVPSPSPFDFPPVVRTLGEHFASRGISAYLVGGAIRDALLGRETGDVDLSVDGDTRKVGAEMAGALGGRLVPLDDERGIVRVVPLGRDGGPSIDLSPLRGGIHADLAQRDFTLDAMALAVSDAAAGGSPVPLIDPYDGARDLRARVIRALSPSVFADDPARLMRAPRLAAELSFSVADETAQSIRQHAHLVTGVAAERVRDELLKLLAAPSAASSLRLLDDLGLLCLVVPELASAKGVTQPKEHHWDVFNHCIETAGQVERLFAPATSVASPYEEATAPGSDSMREYFAEDASDGHTRLTLLKLAGLLHDIAKPATRTVEPSGRIRFLGHNSMGAELAEQILGRLRLSRRGTGLVSRMVEHHLRPSQMAQDGELPTARAVFRYYRDAGDAAIDTLYLNLADYLAARGPDLRDQEWSDHRRVVEHILREGTTPRAPERPPKLIDGHEIMRTFSLEPGPRVGSLLDAVHEAQASGEIVSREEAIELIESELMSGGGRA